ncbi:MAG TPA: cupin domain-containing protein [Anaerolineales bacterium]|nr:cupin domain-containing protein [Anaerolineales bacterium]
MSDQEVGSEDQVHGAFGGCGARAGVALFKIGGDEIFRCEEGGFAFLPSNVPQTFLNLTDEPGEIIVVYVPGGGHKFYEEFGPLARSGPPDPKVMGPLFTKYNMTLLGPPLSPD